MASRDEDKKMTESQLAAGTSGGLVAFLTWLLEKGQMKSATTQAWRSAVVKVLEIDGEGWEDVDVDSLDLDDQLRRFAHLRGDRYNTASLKTYGQRFRSAVGLYREYLDDPSDFRPPVGRTTRPGAKRKTPSAGSGTRRSSPAADSAPPSSPNEHSDDDLIEYPFPAQDGQLARLRLPRRLRASDAERLCAYIRSIAIDDET